VLNATHKSFRQAKRRCNDPRSPSYASYGGRGIKFLLPSWQELEAAIGPRPDGFTLDRINSNGNYEIGNVKWSDATEQNRNRRNVVCSIELAKEIRSMAKRGYYHDMIASKLNLNIHTVEAVIRGKQWK
jgi:hypothetical protein